MIFFYDCDQKYSRFVRFPCIIECCFSFSLLSTQCVGGCRGVGDEILTCTRFGYNLTRYYTKAKLDLQVLKKAAADLI